MGSFIISVDVPAVKEWKEMAMGVRGLYPLKSFFGSGSLNIRKTPIAGVKY